MERRRWELQFQNLINCETLNEPHGPTKPYLALLCTLETKAHTRTRGAERVECDSGELWPQRGPVACFCLYIHPIENGHFLSSVPVNSLNTNIPILQRNTWRPREVKPLGPESCFIKSKAKRWSEQPRRRAPALHAKYLS